MSDSSKQFSVAPIEMTRDEFVRTFGGVYEHSPEVAKTAWKNGIDQSHSYVDQLSNEMATIVDGFSSEKKLSLINIHPDLAGKAAKAGELTDESNAEQSSAGIDQCTADEFSQFQELNKQYKDKFGFRFIMAVKGSNRHLILAAYEERLKNSTSVELVRALEEINKIAYLRLLDIAAHRCKSR